MPTIARENGMKVVIWPADHLPPHAHVLGAGWEVRVLLGAEAVYHTVAHGRPTNGQVREAVALVGKHLEVCNAKWREIHG